MNVIRTFEVTELADLDAVAAAVDRQISPGDRISLEGEMGAGKTSFVRAFLRRRGYSDPVVSPTYPLLVDYEVEGQKFIHIDGFRLEGKGEPWDPSEWGGAIVFVEWAEKTSLPSSSFKYKLTFDVLNSKRRISFFSV